MAQHLAPYLQRVRYERFAVRNSGASTVVEVVQMQGVLPEEALSF